MIAQNFSDDSGIDIVAFGEKSSRILIDRL